MPLVSCAAYAVRAAVATATYAEQPPRVGVEYSLFWGRSVNVSARSRPCQLHVRPTVQAPGASQRLTIASPSKPFFITSTL